MHPVCEEVDRFIAENRCNLFNNINWVKCENILAYYHNKKGQAICASQFDNFLISLIFLNIFLLFTLCNYNSCAYQQLQGLLFDLSVGDIITSLIN